MTAWRISLTQEPPRPQVPGKAAFVPRWAYVAEEPGIRFFVGEELRQDVRRFEGLAETRDQALEAAQLLIDRELERRARYEIIYYPEEPEEADPDAP